MRQWSFSQSSKNLQYQDGRYQRSLQRAQDYISEQDNFQGLFQAFPALENVYNDCTSLIISLEERLINEDSQVNLYPVQDLKDSVWNNLRRAHQSWQQSMRSSYINDPREIGVDLCREFLEELATDIRRSLDTDQENLLEDKKEI